MVKNGSIAILQALSIILTNQGVQERTESASISLNNKEFRDAMKKADIDEDTDMFHLIIVSESASL